MKRKINTFKKITAVAVSCLGCGSAFGTTTTSKGAIQSTDYGYGQGATSNLPMLARGVQELGVSGFMNWENETNYALNLSYGRFITDQWMFGGRVGIDGQNSDAGYSIGVFGEYNHLTGTQWVPFIGLALDYNRLENDGSGLDTMRAGLEVGVKYFIRSNMAISLAAGGGWNSDSFPSEDDFQKQINLGLRFYF